MGSSIVVPGNGIYFCAFIPLYRGTKAQINFAIDKKKKSRRFALLSDYKKKNKTFSIFFFF